MPAEMPVAIVTAATSDEQVVTRTTLDALGTDPVGNPSVIVVGEVAARDVLRDLPELAVLATAQEGVSG